MAALTLHPDYLASEWDAIARDSVNAADALIAELNKPTD